MGIIDWLVFLLFFGCFFMVIITIRKHKWSVDSVISIIIALIAILIAFIQGLGTNNTQEVLSNNQDIIIYNQENEMEIIKDIKQTIDSGFDIIEMIGDTPSDEVTDQIVENRNDVIYKKDIVFFVDVKVRKEGEKNWRRSINVEIGDCIEVQAEYMNRYEFQADDIVIRSFLPSNMEYIEQSTYIRNSNHPDGILLSDNICKNGINIGSYGTGANAYLIFKAKVIDQSLAEGLNHLMLYVSANQNYEVLFYHANIYVYS